MRFSLALPGSCETAAAKPATNRCVPVSVPSVASPRFGIGKSLNNHVRCKPCLLLRYTNELDGPRLRAWSFLLKGSPMIIALTIVHIIVCFFLIIVVLLQSGKAADLAGAFGGMGSQTAFGPRGSATVLSKATTIAAVMFMVTSLSLSILYTRSGSGNVGGASVLDHTAPAKSGAPVAPKSQTIPVQIPAPAKK